MTCIFAQWNWGYNLVIKYCKNNPPPPKQLTSFSLSPGLKLNQITMSFMLHGTCQTTNALRGFSTAPLHCSNCTTALKPWSVSFTAFSSSHSYAGWSWCAVKRSAEASNALHLPLRRAKASLFSYKMKISTNAFRVSHQFRIQPKWPMAWRQKITKSS